MSVNAKRLIALTWLVNSTGFLAFLAWLAKSRERIVESREGVLYLIPLVAFLFVFAGLLTVNRSVPSHSPEED